MSAETSDTVVPYQEEVEFQPFPKLARLFRNMVITEKLDGTNAAVIVTASGEVHAQSRKRLITPGKNNDNFGFAGWVADHADELRELGEGYHYGEWYGLGIQRTYGLDHKRFALFNAARYGEACPPPECCHVVPVLSHTTFNEAEVHAALALLRDTGSFAVPGFMNPEGIVVYHTAVRRSFKVTLENDEVPKALAKVVPEMVPVNQRQEPLTVQAAEAAA